MIVRASTPKGLSRAGRFAVLGMAALLLPLAPGLAQEKKITLIEANEPTGLNQLQHSDEIQARQSNSLPDDKTVEDRIAEKLKTDPELIELTRRIAALREQVGTKRDVSQKLIEDLEGQLARAEVEVNSQRNTMKAARKSSNDDTVEAAVRNDRLQSLQNREELLKRNLEQLKFEASLRPALSDPARSKAEPALL